MSDYRDNFPQVAKGLLDYTNETVREIATVVNKLLGMIGMTAVSDFMISSGRGGKGEGRMTAPVNPNKLTMRSGELAKSVMGTQGISAKNTGGVPHHIRKITVKGSIVDGMIGTDLKYGAVHEDGGEIPITKRSRGYFFAMYKKTQNPMWLYMAITKKNSFTMKARPYLHPAREKVLPMAVSVFNIDIAKLIKKHGL